MLSPIRHKYDADGAGSARALYLVVSNIEVARAELFALGIDVSEVFHPTAPGAQFQFNGTSGRASGPAPNHATYGSFATFSDPDGNSWLLQEITKRLPGRIDTGVTSFSSAGDGERPRRTRKAHWRIRYKLARLVRKVHGSRAGRGGAAVLSDYNVIIIGGGSPGEHCAGALVEGGLHVAIVERELVGGECSYWACIPSKTLLRPGEAVHAARDALMKAELDVSAALAWRELLRCRPGALTERSRHRPAPRPYSDAAASAK